MNVALLANPTPELRLVEPGNPSTHLSERIKVRGFSTLPNTSIYIKFEDSGFQKISPSFLLQSFSHSDGVIEAIINLAPLAAHARQFSLCFAAEVGEEILFSNSVNCALPARSSWKEPRGGFLIPKLPFFAGGQFPIQGWACCLGDKLENVRIEVGGKDVGPVTLGLPSPYIAASLSGPEEATQAIFCKTIPKINSRSPQSVRAYCRFRSGRELELSSNDFSWIQAGSNLGEIERVALDERLIIEGWVFTPGFSAPMLELQGALHSVAIENNPTLGHKLEWFPRPDREGQFLEDALRRDYGFRAEVNPAALGRFAGNVRLIANGQPLGSKFMSRRLAELLQVGVERPWERLLQGAFRLGPRLNLPVNRPVKKQSAFVAQEKRVLLAAHNLSDVEGAPKVLLDVARGLAPQAEMQVLSATGGGLLSQFKEVAEVEVIDSLSLADNDWGLMGEGLKKASEVFESFKPQCVYANSLDSFWAILLADHYGVPVVWALHESVNPKEAKAGIDFRFRVQILAALRSCQNYIFVSEKTCSLFENVLEGKVVSVIPNGLDFSKIEKIKTSIPKERARERLGISPSETVLSIIGTTTARKGQDLFIEAMAELKKLLPERKFRFFVVGARPGNYLGELRLQREQLGLRETLEFVPETPEVAPYYLSSDVLIIASREESAPLVSLEAFAYGVPLVSTSVFGLSEQIRNSHNALVAEDPPQMAEAARRIIEDEQLAAQLIKGGIDDLKDRFSLRSAVESHVEEVLRLL